MKSKKSKTVEKILIDILLIIVAFIITGYAVYSYMNCSKELESNISTTDLVQQQEMLDYQYSQGRTNINVY